MSGSMNDSDDVAEIIYQLSADLEEAEARISQVERELKARIATLERLVDILLPQAPNLRLPGIPEMRV